MDTISNTVWQRKGSSIIFDQKSIGSFISDGALISLRKMLSWSEKIPPVPPVSSRTILVSGLETVIETIEPQEAEYFLTHKIRPLLINLQNQWPDQGIVFGFSAHPKAFEEITFDDEVLFRRRDRKTVRISEGLWDGSSSVNMKRIVCEDEKQGEEVNIGYYVARIS